jgi:hypothetical protein
VFQDFEELLESLNDAGVRYLIGGAHALALHARPRATKDLELFIEPTKANAARFIVALRAFFGTEPPSYVTEVALLDPDMIIQLGVAPVRVDVLSAFATMTFREAWKQREDAAFGSVRAHYLGRMHLIREKLHFDRPQDRADVAVLRAVLARTKRAVRTKRSRSAKMLARATP